MSFTDNQNITEYKTRKNYEIPAIKNVAVNWLVIQNIANYNNKRIDQYKRK